MKLSKSLQDYLETIYILEFQNGFSRVKELASVLNVKLPSVNKALNELGKRNLVIHERYGYIKLTADGKKIASKLVSNHNILIDFFKSLGFNNTVSLKYGCYLEHIVDEKDISRFQFLSKRLKDIRL